MLRFAKADWNRNSLNSGTKTRIVHINCDAAHHLLADCPRALVVKSSSGDIFRQGAAGFRRNFWPHTSSSVNAIEVRIDLATAMSISELSGVACSTFSAPSFGISARFSQLCFGTSACSSEPSFGISVPSPAPSLAIPAPSLAPWAARQRSWFGQYQKWKAPDREG
jgi:hypothetical protein